MTGNCKNIINKISLFWLLFVALSACNKNTLIRNPYLNYFPISQSLNLNLPQYDNLRFTGGTLLIENLGIKGIIVFNLNGTDFLAWEASCPNHLPNNCSQTQITGVFTQCSCEEYQYSLANGQLLNPDGEQEVYYPLLSYRARLDGNTILLTN